MGAIILQFTYGSSLILGNVYYILKTYRNLTFVFCLVKSRYSIYFSEIVTIFFNKDFICSGIVK